ncbi:hypothetical protein TNCV_4436211 [Trichonephila clavipes]|nr:hypothetical protein TNCV_4436211 [Trichonephila clavipes]
MWSPVHFQGSLLLCEDLSRNDNGPGKRYGKSARLEEANRIQLDAKNRTSPLLCLIELSFPGERLPILLEHNGHHRNLNLIISFAEC